MFKRKEYLKRKKGNAGRGSMQFIISKRLFSTYIFHPIYQTDRTKGINAGRCNV